MHLENSLQGIGIQRGRRMLLNNLKQKGLNRTATPFMQGTDEHKMSRKSFPLIQSILTCCNMSIDLTQKVVCTREMLGQLVKDARISGTHI
jgi:hypothetical protein